jgi:hypothetical protein
VPPKPQTLEPPRYVESPVPASRAESRPSTMSALSLGTLVSELTAMGALPWATLRCNALEAGALLELVTKSAGLPPTLALSWVVEVALFIACGAEYPHPRGGG